jgi:beta-glucosidase-like glycosyl hydrolase
LRATQAIEAGADLVLLGHLPDQPRLLAELATRYRQESLERIDAARGRLRRRLPDFGIIGAAEHLELAQQIAERAVTVTRGASKLPLVAGGAAELALITMPHGDLTPADTSSAIEPRLERQLRSRHRGLRVVSLPPAAGRSTTEAT